MRISPIRPFNNINFKNSINEPKETQTQNTNPPSSARLSVICALQRVLMPPELSGALRETSSAKRKADALCVKARGRMEAVSEGSKTDAKEALEMYNLLIDLYKSGDEYSKEGKLIRKITPLEDDFATMEEFSDSGKLLSQTVFFSAKPCLYREGFQTLPNGTKRNSLEIHFQNDRVEKYLEGCEERPDGTKIYSIVSTFINNKISKYSEDCEIYPDGTKKKALEILFIDKNSGRYSEGCEKDSNGSLSIQKELWLEDGKPVVYKKGFNKSSPKYSTLDDIISYKNGLPVLHKKDTVLTGSKGFIKSDTITFLHNSTAHTVAIDCNFLTKDIDIGYKLTDRGWVEATAETLGDFMCI